MSMRALVAMILLPYRGSSGAMAIERDTCPPRSSVSLREGARLGDSIGAGALAEPALAVLRNRRGELLVSQMMAADGRPFLFDNRGVFLRRIGRVGTHSSTRVAVMRMVLNSKDSLFAIDVRHQQVLAAGGGYDTARAVPWDAFSAAFTDIIALPDGRFVATGEIKTRDAVGYPLHLLDAWGRWVLSFGSDKPTFRFDRPAMNRRSLAVSSRRCAFWAAHDSRYEIECWVLRSRHPERAQVIDVHEPWFRPNEDVVAGRRTQLVGLREDGAGRLWMIIYVPDSLAPPAEPKPTSRRPMARPTKNFRPGDVFDTVIHVLDPTTSCVLAAGKVPEAAIGLLSNNEIAVSRRYSNGRDYVQLLTAAIQPVTKKRR